MSWSSWAQLRRYLLPVVIVVYLALGVLYAVYTPAWQAPDEPAHYNYIRYLAEQRRFPVLKPGDYPAAYLEEIKAAHFPPAMSIDPIRYEFHQPPLYYLLAVPVYRLFGGALLPLRLFSVALGALLLVVIYWAGRALVPGRPLLVVGATAFVALLPMHLTVVAAVNNDPLAELFLALLLLLIVRYLKRSARPPLAAEDGRFLVLMGVASGLGLVTKSSVYVVLPLVLLAIAVRHLWLDEPPPPASGSLKAAALYLLPAIALAVPWWLRNIALYGHLDFLGLGRHEQVVAGQLRTADFIASHGFAQLGRDFVLTSFRSFWGQFGWMGVLLDQRLYQALAILSALALIGLAMWAIHDYRLRAQFATWQWAAASLLFVSALSTLASYLWYNTTFVQHQGRYLFPALVPIGLAVALGWREALRRERALWFGAGLLAAGTVLRLTGLLSNWPFLLLSATALALAAHRLLPRRWEPLVQAVPYLLLLLLALVSLFLFIVPQLRT